MSPAVARVQRSGQRRSPSERMLGFGPVSIALACDDGAAADWLVEVLSPWFSPTTRSADWRVGVSSDPRAHAELLARRPCDAAPRACFAHDTRVVAFPAWSEGADRVALCDDQRSCFLVVQPSRLDLIGDPTSPRWRFTAMWALHEIVATRLRRTHLDLHAAAVEADGRAVVIAGPKGAGKTTLALHLLRSGRCRAIANDRAFAGAAGTSFEVRGVPTAVKLRAPTLAEFPELLRGLPGVERPYLYALDDLARMRAIEPDANPGEVALSPAQFVRQLGVEPLASAPLGAVLFPEIRNDLDGSVVERLDPREAAAAIWANLYGARSGPRPPTVFEDFGGGASAPPRGVADALSDAVPAYRVLLGPNAHAAPDFAARLIDTILG